MNNARPVLFVHSSDELYGSDRMLLEFIDALPAGLQGRALVWLPADVPHGGFTLCQRLGEMGVRYEHVDLPILRRRNVTARGMARTVRRATSLRSRLHAIDPQMVVLATSATLPVGLVLGRRPDRRVVLHLQEVWEGMQGRVLGTMAHRVDRVVAISEAARASLPEGLRERAIVVPNATPEPGAWSPVDPDGEELVFLVASRWMPWKGHEVLLSAWDAAGSPGRLVILGGAPAAGAGTDVRGLAARATKPGTIDVVGEVADPDPYIRAADVMVVPSVRDEPFGLVTIEAFARGRPVIGSDNGGLRETINDGAGWRVPPGDRQALAARLASLTRPEVAAAGMAARRRYEQHYSRPAFAAGLRAALGVDEES